MPLQIKNFATLLQDQATAIQAEEGKIQFAPGSIVLALIEANAGVSLWIQAIILQLLSLTRASTSEGIDLDTWMKDFNFTRQGAIAASGNVTFKRFTATQQALVPVGAQVQTTSPSVITFSVIVDTSNPNYNSALNGYILAAGILNIDVPVQCTIAGSLGNVSIDQINIIVGTIVGVDTVSNDTAFTNGRDQESDDQFRTRFISYINGLFKATYAAVAFVTESVIGVEKYNIVENQSLPPPPITSNPGFFYVVIDDGSGNASQDLINSVKAAVDKVRPLAILFDVIAPANSSPTANISATIALDIGYDFLEIETVVEDALTNFIRSIPIGGTLLYSRLSKVIYDSSPGIIAITNLLLNGGTTDVVADPYEVVKVGTITITESP